MLIRGRLPGALATGALLLGGAVAGCGSSADDPGTKNLDVAQAAAAATAKQQSSHLVLDLEETIGGRTVKIRSDGDRSGRYSRSTFDFGAMVTGLAGSLSGFQQKLDQLGGADALKADMIFDGDKYLFRMPALQNGLKTLAGQKDLPPWARVDLDSLGKLTGVDLKAMFASGAGSEQAVGYLKAISGDLKQVGTEDVDGVSTTHYRGTVDLAHLGTAGLTDAQRKALGQASDLLKKSGASGKSPIDVWIDKDDLVRREVFAQTSPMFSVKGDLRLSDYGKAVKIQSPPAAQQYDLLKVVDGLIPGGLAAAMKSFKP